MRTQSTKILFRVFALAGCALMTHAQDLRMMSHVEGVTATIANGGTVTIPAESPGQRTRAVILLTNVGPSALDVTGIGIAGRTEIALAEVPALPVSLAPGDSTTFNVLFTPTFTSAAAQVGITTIWAGMPSTWGFRVLGTVAGFGGPQLEASYEDPITRNAIRVSGGGVIGFPQVDVGDRSAINFTITNSGSSQGTVDRITVSGSPAFRIEQLPVLPATVSPGGVLRFVVRFAPEAREMYSALLRIEVSGASWDTRLEGTGTGAAFEYSTGDGAPVPPGGTVEFAGTPVGETRQAVLQIRNAGTSQGRIAGFTLSNASFRIVDAPFTPVLLNPGESAQVTLAFTPPGPGSHAARARIGEVEFTLSGTGLGASLEYSYASGDSHTPIEPGGAVMLGSAAVGESSGGAFTISNRGNEPAPLFAIAFLSGAVSAFELQGVPALPLNLEPGASLTFSVRFVPDDVGTLNAGLGVNGATFTVRGTGTPPSLMPQFRFEGAVGVQSALQQPAIGVTVSEPYPLELKGVLTLAFVSDVFGANPAVQFSSGGRTAAFVIPANSTEAVFDNAQKMVRVQTGTVAGDLVITPTLTTRAGLSMIPDSQEHLTLSVERRVPSLLDAQIASRTNDRFVVSVTGYATTRSLSRLDLQLNAGSGVRLNNGLLTVDLQSPAMVWFQSSSSEAFGGLFKISVPVQLQGGGSAEDHLAHIESVTVRISNELGAGEPVNLPLR